MRIRFAAIAAVLAIATLLAPSVASAKPGAPNPTVSTVTTGIQGAFGSTVGPDGALYVTEMATGSVLRVDIETGATTVYATGLPTGIGIGGPIDVVFHGNTAYVLVTLIGPFFGTADPSGVYRIDGPEEWTLIADLGAWAVDNPPDSSIDFFIPTGVHYSIDTFRGALLVTDAHHNKLLRVGRDGAISEIAAFPNIVPTGLETHGNDILIAMSGPVPHVPEDGYIVSLDANRGATETVAAGTRLLLDVERGRGGALFGLGQGFHAPGTPEGDPAQPNTGEFVVADGSGGFVKLVDELNLPTSLEIIGTTAYITGLGGDIVRIDGIAVPPYGS